MKIYQRELWVDRASGFQEQAPWNEKISIAYNLKILKKKKLWTQKENGHLLSGKDTEQ